jgi:hypothetical protein
MPPLFYDLPAKRPGGHTPFVDDFFHGAGVRYDNYHAPNTQLPTPFGPTSLRKIRKANTGIPQGY